MQQLVIGSDRAVPLAASIRLPFAPTLAESLAAGKETLLAHPLADRDKVFFTSAGTHYVGFVAGLASLDGLFETVAHDGREVPVVSPLVPVRWTDEAITRPAEVALVLGLKRKEGAPDTYADRPLPKPAPVRGVWPWVLLTFMLAATAAFAVARLWGWQAALAGSTGLVMGLAAWSLTSDRLGPRVVAPIIDRPEDEPFWQTVQEIASRQVRATALPGEWVVAAVPRGERRGFDWSPLIGLAVGGGAAALALRLG